MWIFKYKPFTHRRIHFRDWSWKDKILINHISNLNKIVSHIGACTCAQEPKTCARGRFCILKRILEIGHVKTKLSLTIYLTTTKISATSERANAHRSQKRACVAGFSRAQLFSYSNMHCRYYAWKDKILNDHLSNNNNKNSATLGHASAHKSRKHTFAAVFSLAR